jgi:hypothetical protein
VTFGWHVSGDGQSRYGLCELTRTAIGVSLSARRLPAPKDGFRFTARFYGAATPLIDAIYDMPGVLRVD